MTLNVRLGRRSVALDRFGRFVGPGLLAIAVMLASALTYAVVARVNEVSRADTLAQERTDSASAARVAASALLSYDYASIDKIVSRNAPLMTDAYAQTYADLIANQVRSLATANKAVLVATVRAVGVQTASSTRASVLVFADLRSTNSHRASAASDRVVVVVTLARQQLRWLVDGVTGVPSG